MGAGMNARGAMEIILATIGLSVGVLTQNMFSIIVVTAIVTSLMAPPLLRWTLGHVEMGDEEKERLEAEDRQSGSFVGNLKRVLLPTKGGTSAGLTARLLGLLVATQDVEVTAMFVGSVPKEDKGKGENQSDEVLSRVEDRLDLSKSQVRRVVRDSEGDNQFGEVVLAEAEKGYDLLVLSSTGPPSERGSALFGEGVDDLVRDAPCPVLIVRTAGPRADEDASESADSGDESDPLDLHRSLLPVTGADTDRHAAEIAFALAADRDMVVDVVHVVRAAIGEPASVTTRRSKRPNRSARTWWARSPSSGTRWGPPFTPRWWWPTTTRRASSTGPSPMSI